MGVISSEVLARLAKAGVAVVILVALAVGTIAFSGCNGGDGDTSVPAGATVSASPTPPQGTLIPTTEPTTVSTLPPAPTQIPGATPDPACAARDHNHLNINKLAAQPTMADAVFTEIDDDSIRIMFEGVEVIVSGVGSSLAIRTNLANDRLAPLTRAIDDVAYEC